MAGRGGYYAITPEQMGRLLAARKESNPDQAVMEALWAIEEKMPERYSYYLDKSWDGIHRTLNDDNTPGGRLMEEVGDWPLCLIVLGGQRLYEPNDEHIYLIRPDEVAELAAALHEIDEGWARKRFFVLRECFNGIDEEAFGYVWGHLQDVPAFFARAAAEGRAVVFNAGL
jgi:hypothetical protein